MRTRLSREQSNLTTLVAITTLAIAACGSGSADNALPIASLADSNDPEGVTQPGDSTVTETTLPTTAVTIDRSGTATASSDRIHQTSLPELTTNPPTTQATDDTAASQPDTAADEPLLINLTIHAEGWIAGVEHSIAHDRHVDALLDIATTAASYDALLSIDVDTYLVQAMAAHGTEDVLIELQALGHEISVHADTGGKGVKTLEEFTAELVRQRDELAALGVETTNISGICSRGPWVEAAIAAEFETVTGLVGYCMTSLDPANVPADARAYVAGCASPATCHDAVQIPVEDRAAPWVANDSEDWLTPGAGNAAHGLTLIVSESASGIHCPDGVCTIGGSEDATTITDWIDQYLDVQQATGEQAALSFTWSIGSIPDDSFADELFAAISVFVDAGTVQWANNVTIGALA